MELIKYKEFVSEAYVNAVGDRGLDTKEKYKDQVWDILQSSYKKIGGIKGTGFKNKEDMVANIPMWKLVVRNGKVSVVVMYKDKGGRKTVACGTDGSLGAKKDLAKIMVDEVGRSYGEKSKGALGLVLKSIPWNGIEPFLQSPQTASKQLGYEVEPVLGYKGTLPDDAKQTLSKYPQLIKYGYMRELGGKMMFKVMIGTPNLKIR